MKKYLLSNIIILLISLLFLSCTGDVHYTPSMRKAELIMDTVPDSARILLSKDSSIMKNENKPTRMYYDMLLTLAKDKCYIPHTSDSVMLAVVDYYESHGTPHQKLEANYLLGRVYNDLNMTADALKYFQRALWVEGTDSSDIYLARTNNQIGHIYMYQNIFRKAIPYFYATYRYSSIAKDSTVMVFALRDIGRYYYTVGNTTKGIMYFEKAGSLINKSRLYKLRQFVYSELSLLYYNIGDYQKSIQAFHLSDDKKTPLIGAGTSYDNAGDIFKAMNQTDSAIYYYKKSFKETSPYPKRAAAFSLKEIYAAKGDYKQANNYADSCIMYTDSVCNNALSENKNLIQSLNNKLIIERKLSELRKNLIIIILASAFILIITILIVKHKLKRIKEKEALYESVKKALELKGKDYKEKAESKLAELNQKIEIADKENNNLRMRLLQLEIKKEEENIGKIILDEERQQLVIEEFRETDLYRYFKNKSETDQNNFISNEKWDELEAYLNNNFDQFCKQLRHKYKVDNRNLRMCCLIKLFFTNKEIGEIFCISRSAISNMRSRLYCKLFGKNGSATDLDVFIRSFPDCVNNM